MDGDTSYLKPGFDVNNLKIPQIKKILIFHKVNFTSNAKKAQLVKIFETQITAKVDQILKSLDESSDARPIKNASSKKSAVDKVLNSNASQSDSDSDSDSSDSHNETGQSIKESLISVADNSEAEESFKKQGTSESEPLFISDDDDDNNDDNNDEDEDEDEDDKDDEYVDEGAKDKASDSENDDKETSFTKYNSFQKASPLKTKKRKLLQDDTVDEPDKKKSKDLFDLSVSDGEDIEFEKLVSKSLKDSTQILQSPQRELKADIKKHIGNSSKKLSDDTKNFKVGKLSTSKAVADLRNKVSPIKKDTPKKMSIHATPSKSASKKLISPKEPKSPTRSAAKKPGNKDDLARVLGINVIRDNTFKPATTPISFGTPKNSKAASPKEKKPKGTPVSVVGSSKKLAKKSFKKQEEKEEEEVSEDNQSLEEYTPAAIENTDNFDSQFGASLESDDEEIRDITEEFAGGSDSQDETIDEVVNDEETDENLEKFHEEMKQTEEDLAIQTEEDEKVIETLAIPEEIPSKFSIWSYLKYLTMFLLLTALSGVGYWYTDQRVLVGYCGYSITRSSFPNPNNNPYVEKIENFLGEYLTPDCLPCPDKAECFPYFRVSCRDDYLKIKPITYYLTGEKCIPDLRKQRRIENMIAISLDILRSRNAAINCGKGSDYEAGLTKEELYETLSKLKADHISDDEFEEIWRKAEEYIENDPEITTVRISSSQSSVEQDSQSEIKEKGFRSSSLDNLNFQCRTKKLVNFLLKKYKAYLIGAGLILSSIVGAYSIIKINLAKKHEIENIYEVVIERLRNQKFKADSDITGMSRAYLISNALRDELLINDKKNKVLKWKQVSKKVENNANVRAQVMEIYGEITRAWEWASN